MFVEERPGKKGMTYRFGESYTDPLTGKSKKVYHTSSKNTAVVRKEIQRILNNKIDEILKNFNNKKNMRLEELVTEFVEIDRPLRKITTQQHIDYHQKTLTKWFNKDMLISKITALYLQRTINSLLSTHSYNYVKAVYSLLKQSLKYGKRMGYINDISYLDDVIFVKNKRTPEQLNKDRNKFLTKDELILFLSKLKVINERAATLFEFQSLTGLRIGELRALRSQDYNAKEGYIDVNATLTHNNIRIAPKNEYSVRKVSLSNEAKQIIIKCLQLNKAREGFVQGYNNPDNYIFVTDGGVPYDSHYLNKLLKKVPFHKTVTTHTFRHTHISLLSEANIPLKTIMARVGHNEPKTTLSVYTHVTDEMKKQEIEALNAINLKKA